MFPLYVLGLSPNQRASTRGGFGRSGKPRILAARDRDSASCDSRADDEKCLSRPCFGRIHPRLNRKHKLRARPDPSVAAPRSGCAEIVFTRCKHSAWPVLVPDLKASF